MKTELQELLDKIAFIEEGKLYDRLSGSLITYGVGDVITDVDNSSAAWAMLTGVMPKGDVFLVEKDDSPYLHWNMIDTGTLMYADGMMVPEDLQEKYDLVVEKEMLSYVEPEQVDNTLPLGVTRLKNGKYRFKRNVAKYGMKLDRVDESYNYITQVARNFEATLQHKKSVEVETNASLKGSDKKERNIHKRGNQYYVEFVVNGQLKTPLVTYDFEQAVIARDKFLEELTASKNEAKEQERVDKISHLIDDFGRTLLSYDKLKYCMKYMTQEEYLHAISSVKIERK